MFCVKSSKDTIGYISFNSIDMKFSDQANPLKQEDLWLLGAAGNGERLLRGTRFFLGVKKVFWNWTVVMVAHSAQPGEYTRN